MRLIYFLLNILFGIAVIPNNFIVGVVPNQRLLQQRTNVVEAWQNPPPSRLIGNLVTPVQQLSPGQLEADNLAAEQLAKRVMPGLDPGIGPDYNKLVNLINKLAITPITNEVMDAFTGEVYDVHRFPTDREIRNTIQVRQFDADEYTSQHSRVSAGVSVNIADLDIAHIQDIYNSVTEPYNQLVERSRQLSSLNIKEFGFFKKLLFPKDAAINRAQIDALNQIEETKNNINKLRAFYDTAIDYSTRGRYGAVEEFAAMARATKSVIQRNIQSANLHMDQADLLAGTSCPI
jgi:hypothetical protein